MNGTDLSKALHDGQRAYGTCIVSTSPQWVGMIAGIGLDFVFIDTEHIPIDRAQLGWMCQAYAGHGLAPIVRIPKPDPYLACMAIDGGAAGVVAPYMEDPAEVQDLRGAVKYRPLKGRRLQRVLDGEEELEGELAAYLAEYRRGKLLTVNIESVPAIDALDDLLAVPDIDALLVGPHDLSISLGIPEQYADPAFTEAMRTIIAKAREQHVGVGFHYSFGIEDTLRWARLGANLIVHSTDIFLVRDVLRADMMRFHRELGDGVSGGPAGAGGAETVVV